LDFIRKIKIKFKQHLLIYYIKYVPYILKPDPPDRPTLVTRNLMCWCGGGFKLPSCDDHFSIGSHVSGYALVFF